MAQGPCDQFGTRMAAEAGHGPPDILRNGGAAQAELSGDLPGAKAAGNQADGFCLARGGSNGHVAKVHKAATELSARYSAGGVQVPGGCRGPASRQDA